ncbi:hypothetical protein PENSUB_4504 [Penicillium subrubescens]|uniref:Uncharacterized protein n=2 Tax=Penicillium subrubescens TaxID=1316194 RepID=A0A1Q5UC49_9EURO|nr:hypothetical protein PENSUB_4504 [Penicillium subrubescens]
MPNINDPFWAQPPVGFQTGLWQQFAPRVNFTTKYDKILEDDFPKDCRHEPGALFIHYENMTDIGGYIVDICMPGDQKQSPWKATRKRQDFSEELYVKMTLEWKGEDAENAPGEYLSFAPGKYSFKVTLNTTAGYFELPNYENGQLPGPLLDDPDNGQENTCGAQCRLQSQTASNYQKKRYFVGPVTNSTEVALANLTESLSSVVSKGPLLFTTLALFTTGSYLDIEHTAAQAYHNGGPDEWGGCIDIPPLVQLLHGEDDKRVSLDIDPCIDGSNTKGHGLLKLVADYIWLFSAEEQAYYFNYIISPSAKHIENAFTAAAFMAVDEWMQYGSTWSDLDTSGSLNWDLGVDQQVPSIPHAGVVLISILLALYLLCILGLSLYAAWTPRWTNQLDSFAMMRIGSAAPDRFPLRLAHSSDEVNDLDQLPGWIGSTTGVETDNTCISELGLGGETALEGKKRYRCYAGGERS